MVDEAGVRIESLEAALGAVATVGAVARDFAQKAEEGRSLPTEVVDAFDEAGLWGASSPHEVGGGGLGSLLDQYEISRSIAYEDGSAGWAWFICGSTAMLLGSRLPSEGRLEVFADRVAPIAGVFMPGGQARPVDGGLFVQSGRWQFGSGVAHSPWVMANVLVVDEAGAPTPGLYGPIDVRSIVVPHDEVTIVDDWHVAGLRGTGSMSFTMEGITVPDRRTFHFFGPASIDEPRYRLPLFSLVGAPFAGVATGLARRALDEVISALPTRARPPMFRPESESPTAQLVLGRALAAVRAAHDSTRAVFGRYDSRSDAGEDLAQLPMAGRAEIHQQVVWAAETCVGAINDVFRLGGASAIYEPGVLQRCWRDANVMLQHAYMTPTMHEYSAQVALGQVIDAFNV